MENNIVECHGVVKAYGSSVVLRGVDFAAQGGEVVTIVGPSGAGKTTLLQILGTLTDVSAGSVHIGGRDISQLKERELAEIRRRDIGFVFQFHHLLPEFSALENVCIPGFIAAKSGQSYANVRDRAQELLRIVGMEHRMDGKPSELSGGEGQRVAVARALINSPKVIFADEPSGNLDTVNRRELHELFFKLRDTTGCTFVIVTHDMELAAMADRCITMRDGVIVP